MIRVTRAMVVRGGVYFLRAVLWALRWLFVGVEYVLDALHGGVEALVAFIETAQGRLS